jgi:glycosyltransferase involved in cell wall biosynthesis
MVSSVRDTLFEPTVDWQPIDPRVAMHFVRRCTPGSVPDADAIFATAWDTTTDVLRLPSSKGTKFHLVQSFDDWSSRDRAEARWRLPLHKVVVAAFLLRRAVERGCDGVVHIPIAVDHLRFRCLLPVSLRPKRVVMRFSLGESRGAHVAIAALDTARREHPDLRAVFFSASSAPRLVPRWIEFVNNPRQAELIEKIYNGSSICLMASRNEGFPLPPAEAMACGCALVSTDIPGVREYADDGVSALLSPPGEPEALARNILRLLQDDGLRIRLALEGRKRIRTFTWERSADLLEEFIHARLPR